MTVEPVLAPLQDDRALLLAGVRSLFLRDAAAVEEEPERADVEAMALLGETSLELHQRDVASLVDHASLVDQRHDHIGLGLDAMGMTIAALRLGLSASVSRSRAHQRMALAALTPKRSASCRRDAPPKTAETTRSRRSSERAWTCMPASFASRQLNQSRADLRNPNRFRKIGKRS